MLTLLLLFLGLACLAVVLWAAFPLPPARYAAVAVGTLTYQALAVALATR